MPSSLARWCSSSTVRCSYGRTAPPRLDAGAACGLASGSVRSATIVPARLTAAALSAAARPELVPAALTRLRAARTEEHTSELQSRGHLVCRLLLEKKH